jgi:hypothetical protein
MKTYKILVLNDGETWGGIDGASICVISEADHSALCDGSKDVRDIEPIAEIGLSDDTEKFRCINHQSNGTCLECGRDVDTDDQECN